MNQLEITLVIDDPETVRAYTGVDKGLVLDDLREGSLLEKCGVTRVSIVESVPVRSCHHHPFVSTPDNGPCSSCGRRRFHIVHTTPEGGW